MPGHSQSSKNGNKEPKTPPPRRPAERPEPSRSISPNETVDRGRSRTPRRNTNTNPDTQQPRLGSPFATPPQLDKGKRRAAESYYVGDSESGAPGQVAIAYRPPPSRSEPYSYPGSAGPSRSSAQQQGEAREEPPRQYKPPRDSPRHFNPEGETIWSVTRKSFQAAVEGSDDKSQPKCRACNKRGMTTVSKKGSRSAQVMRCPWCQAEY